MSLHVYSLPADLLATLTPRNLVNKPPSRPASPEPSAATPQPATGSRACNICPNATFADVEEQRSHYRSDWHRYNVKTRISGGSTVTEAHFSQLVDGLEDSLSGSASSTDDEDESTGESDAVNALFQKNKKQNVSRSSSPDPSSARNTPPQTALVWFHSPPATQIGIYRVLFPLGIEQNAYVQTLRDMQTRVPEGRKWALFMVAGGHFAGAIVRVSQDADAEELEENVGKKKKPKKSKSETEVLRHKTFHRYTTRRKQGGSQSVNDNSKSRAISAGAMLRRYGEQALREDIQGLLRDWAEDLADCERIFIRASVSNRRIFLDYDPEILAKTDERLRTFPFPTRRPTQSEITRCLQELTRVKVSHFTEEALRAQDEAYLASLPKPRPQPTTSPAVPSTTATAEQQSKLPKLTKEEELLKDKWTKLQDMIEHGRLEPLKSFWEREKEAIGGVDVRVPEFVVGSGPGGGGGGGGGDRDGQTMLMIAAQAGQENVVHWLLAELNADPTIPFTTSSIAVNGGDTVEDDGDTSSNSRRTAYDLTSTKAARDEFRRCAAAYPDRWDWFGAARVPSALSKEMEEERDEKKKAKRKGLKDRVREREAKEREKDKEKALSAPTVSLPPVEEKTAKKKQQQENDIGPRKLGGSGTASGDGVAGLTPEMRVRIERERRARAAEARMKKI